VTVIVVPKPPKGAFNAHRPVSALLKNQILHMQEAEFRLPTRQQTNIYINKIKTEGQAAEYISKVTAKLHPQSAPGGTARKIREQAIPAAAAEGKFTKKRRPKPKTKAKGPKKKRKRK